MKKHTLGKIVLIVIAGVLTLDALVILTSQPFSWSKLAAQSYSTPVPPPPGVAQDGGNAIIDAADDGTVVITSLGPDGDTAVGVTISAEDIANLPDNPEEAIEVAQTEDEFVTIYKLPTNELQANIGPDAEGKIFVYIFDNDPLVCITRYEYSTSDATPRFYGPC